MNILNQFQQIINNIKNNSNNSNKNVPTNTNNNSNINNSNISIICSSSSISNSSSGKNQNNNHNNINNNSDNSKLFFKIFRNIHLKRLIFNHLRLIIAYEKVLVYGLEEYNKHPFRQYITGLSIDDCQVIQYQLIPPSISHISFCSNLNQKELLHQLPSHINSVNILPNFECTAGALPLHIKHVQFHSEFNSPIENGFFHSEVISVSMDSFIKKYDIYFPDSITYLKTKCTTLNPPLELRELDGHFQRIDEAKLLQLRHLQKVTYTPISTISTYINNPPNLPPSVTHLSLNSVVIGANSLPNSISKLFLYDCGLEVGSIPSSVKTLQLKRCSSIKPNYLPDGITNLVFDSKSDSKLEPGIIPRSVKSLKLRDGVFTSTVNSAFIHNSNEPILNEGLQILEFNLKFNYKFVANSLPSTLVSLHLGYCYNQEFTKHSLPANLKYLYLGSDFNKKITSKSLPRNLLHLEFGYSFNQPLYDDDTLSDYGYLPSSLTYLCFGRSFNHKLPNKLSPSLTELHFGFAFTQPINQDSINLNCLKRLKLASSYNKSLLSSSLLEKLIN